MTVSIAYDSKEYHSHPFHYSHPEQMYTTAKLFHIDAPDYEKSDVLEIGCGTGGNLLPMAYYLPNSNFIGVEESLKQVEEGNRHIKKLQVSNIELKHKALADIESYFGKFDYIICHGQYSWVDKPLQKKILQILKSNLKANGLAFISYNTYPGWYSMHGIRDFVQYHTQSIEDEHKRLKEARSLLAFYAKAIENRSNAFSAQQATELKAVLARSDYYLQKDFLEPINSPTYFNDFVDSLNTHKLQYVADAPFWLMYPNNFPGDINEQLIKLKDPIKLGQYIDFFNNQRFRCSLITHQDVIVDRNLGSKDIDRFHIASNGIVIPKASAASWCEENKTLEFQANGMKISVNRVLAKLALKELAAIIGQPISFDDLCLQVQKSYQRELPEAQSASITLESVQEYLREKLGLMRFALSGMINLHARSPNYLDSVQKQPKVSKLVRYQAKDSPFVANLRHVSLKLSDIERALVQYCDGETEIDEIKVLMKENFDQGNIQIPKSMVNAVFGEKERETAIFALTEQALQQLQTKALFIP